MAPSSWLTKQRKPVLITLAADAGLDLDPKELNKSEIVDALEIHLQANALRFANDTKFEDFYATTRRTPYKGTRSTVDVDDNEVKSVVRERGRRSTQVKPEPISEDNDDDDYPAQPPRRPSATTAMPSSPSLPAPNRGTPTQTIIQQRRQSLPPSPTIVVDEVEHATTRFYAGLDDIYTLSGIPEAIDWAREGCSSIATVHLAFLLFEAYGLSRAVMPWTYIFDFPSISLIGTPSFAVKIPDLFVMLCSSFWSPVLLWSATSIFIPLIFAYFFNLTVHTVKRNNARVRVVRYNYDPFTYNVAKFLCVSTVFGAGILQGWVSDDTVFIVESSQFGGFASMLAGTYICGLCSLWQATQR